MDTITLTIPTDWLEGINLSQTDLRQALQLGLSQLRQQQITSETTRQVTQVLLETGRIRHLSTTWLAGEEGGEDRQTPPTLSGLAVSDILISQRRGES
jgi:hypothetical protein